MELIDLLFWIWFGGFVAILLTTLRFGANPMDTVSKAIVLIILAAMWPITIIFGTWFKRK